MPLKKPKPMVEAEVCGTCIHYRQHYVMVEQMKIQPLWYGHCHTPRPHYPPPDGVCPHWQGRDEKKPVSPG